MHLQWKILHLGTMAATEIMRIQLKRATMHHPMKISFLECICLLKGQIFAPLFSFCAFLKVPIYVPLHSWGTHFLFLFFLDTNICALHQTSNYLVDWETHIWSYLLPDDKCMHLSFNSQLSQYFYPGIWVRWQKLKFTAVRIEITISCSLLSGDKCINSWKCFILPWFKMKPCRFD